MKKYIILLALLATASSFAQGTLITAPLTTNPDSLLIYTPQKRAAHIPYTDFLQKLKTSLDTIYNVTETDPLFTAWGKDYNGLINKPVYSNFAFVAPYLRELVPDTYLPSTTGNFILRGSFFTPDMEITIEDHTINYQTFVSSNEFVVNLTTSETEGLYDVTLDNGLEAVFANQLEVVNGTVYQPTFNDWVEASESLDFTQAGFSKLEIFGGTFKNATWNKTFDYTKDFKIRFNFYSTPLGEMPTNSDTGNHFSLHKVSDDSKFMSFNFIINSGGSMVLYIRGADDTNITYIQYQSSFGTVEERLQFFRDRKMELSSANGTFVWRDKDGIIYDFGIPVPENLYLKVSHNVFDIGDIKYIDLDDDSGELPDMTIEKAEHISVNTLPFTGNLSSADNTVQKALETIDGLSLGGGTDDQTASEVPFTPYGTISSTNVQDAIEELKDELDALPSGGIDEETDPIFTAWDKDYNDLINTPTIPTSLAAGNITVSPAIGSNTDAYAVMEANRISIDSIQANMYSGTVYNVPTTTGTTMLDYSSKNFIKVTLAEDEYLQVTPPLSEERDLTLHLQNNSAGNHNVVFPENFIFAGGTPPTLTKTANRTDVLKFDYRDNMFFNTFVGLDYEIPTIYTYTVVRRVNVGSVSSITATDGEINWQIGFSGGAGGPFDNLQVNTGNNFATTGVTWARHGSIPASIPDADFQTLFDSERWDEAGAPEMTYTITGLTPGTYKVRIYAGESNGGASIGSRVFDILLNGVLVGDNIDLVSLFGVNTAGMLEYEIVVPSTSLTITTNHVTDNPAYNGIELLKQD